MPDPTLLKASGYGSILLAMGHALSGRKFRRLRQFQELPNIAFTCSTAGWYQGSAYLVLTALLNFHWAQNPQAPEEPLNRAMAAVLALIAWVSSAWYLVRGLKKDGLITAAAGAFQIWAALH